MLYSEPVTLVTAVAICLVYPVPMVTTVGEVIAPVVEETVYAITASISLILRSAPCVKREIVNVPPPA